MTPAASGLGARTLDHVGVAVFDLDDGSVPWTRLGLTPTGGADAEVPEQGVRVRFVQAGPVALELLAPTDGDGAIARFLARRGPGVHHLAFRVADLSDELARLRREGVDPIDPAGRPGHGGHRVAFLHPRSCGGVLVELVERRP